MTLRRTAVGFLGLFLCGAAPAWASFMLEACEHPGCLRASVKSGFHGGRCCGADFGTDASRCAVKPILGPMESVVSRHLHQPASTSNAADVADIRGRSRFFYADPDGSIPFDTVRFTFLGSAGATDSRNHAGKLAWAKVRGVNAYKFHTGLGFCEDSDECVGFMRVGPLRKMRPYETLLRVDVLADGKLVHRTQAGGRSMSMELLENTTYEVRLLYAMAVPPLDDPPFRVDHWVQLIPLSIPEPSAGLLLLGGAIVLAKLRPGHRPVSRR